MYLTEAQAKQSECPFITEQIPVGHDATGSGGLVVRYAQVHIRCRGSECKMGWRWNRSVMEGTGVDDSMPPGKSQWTGYCGGIGRPWA